MKMKRKLGSFSGEPRFRLRRGPPAQTGLPNPSATWQKPKRIIPAEDIEMVVGVLALRGHKFKTASDAALKMSDMLARKYPFARSESAISSIRSALRNRKYRAMLHIRVTKRN